MANTQTRLLGVIGDPIQHSLSPLLHNFLLGKLALNYCYHAFHLKSADLTAGFAAFQLLGVHGFNVTIPHKEQILPLLAEIHGAARQIEAVNTVVWRENGWHGYNTDSQGFLRSLGDFVAELPGATVVLLGAGGSSRAIVHALIQQRVAAVHLFNRTLARAEALAGQFARTTGFKNFFCELPDSSKIARILMKSRLVINTTSLGMHPETALNPLAESLEIPETALAFDLIYNPVTTRFLQQAAASGARTLNGLDMLIFQGVAALEIWLGTPVEATPFLPELRQILLNQLSKTWE
jgi:shikimate dehydrogenase